MVLLEGKEITKSFGGLKAIDCVSFRIESGKISGFVGPNGAGKTTLFNLITGFLAVDSGHFFYNSKRITNLSTHVLVGLGIARSWQGLRLFNKQTSLENVIIGMPKQARENPFLAMFPLGSSSIAEKKDREKAMSYLEFVGLADRAAETVENLSYPEQKLLSMARLLATEASLLLLDEPVCGLDMRVTEKLLYPLLHRIVEQQGKTICIIEHVIEVVKNLCNWLFFLDHGRLIIEGEPQELIGNPELGRIYFGV